MKYMALLFFIAFSSIVYADCSATTYEEVADKIAHGHSWGKHRSEFMNGREIAGLAMPSSVPVTTPAEFQIHIYSTIASSAPKELSNGRQAFWNQMTGTIVFYDPRNNDCGTAFRPTAGKKYYERQR